jgi:prolyl 4-hydroxylase
VANDGTTSYSTGRTSSTAYLPPDEVVNNIRNRAAEFQGFSAVADIEPLQATRYAKEQECETHYDWGDPTLMNNTNRITSFFAILEANCSDCGTKFPHLKYDWEHEDERLCNYVECGTNSLVVKPIEGSAIFWRNLHENGEGNEKTAHAGLPLSSGTKIGLNIWTRANV